MKSIFKSLTVLSCFITLVACGGSETSSDSSNNTSNASAFQSYISDLKEGLYFNAGDSDSYGSYVKKVLNDDGTLSVTSYEYKIDSQTGAVSWDLDNVLGWSKDENVLANHMIGESLLAPDGRWISYNANDWSYSIQDNVLLKQFNGETFEKTTVQFVNNLDTTHNYTSGSRAYGYHTISIKDYYFYNRLGLGASRDGTINTTSIANLLAEYPESNKLPLDSEDGVTGVSVGFQPVPFSTDTQGVAIYKNCPVVIKALNDSCSEEKGTWEQLIINNTNFLKITPPSSMSEFEDVRYFAEYPDKSVVVTVDMYPAGNTMGHGDEEESWKMPHNKTGYNYWIKKHFPNFPGVLEYQPR